MGSLDKRIEAREKLYQTETPQDEEARRRYAQETIAELKRRLDRIAETAAFEEQVLGDSRRRHALEEVEEAMHRGDTVRELYRYLFDGEIGDEEYQRREALRLKYGAVSLAPRSEQESLRRFG